MFNKILVIATSALLFSLVACSDDNPSGGSVPPVTDESSSSVTGTSSDDVGGSAANVSSSSVTANSSSSAKPPKNTAACLWNASKGDYLVNTGFDPDSLHYAGLWYNFSDDPDGGVSEIHMPDVCVYEGPEYDCMVALLEFCGSYCAEFRFRKGLSNEIFAGMGFEVAGFDNPYVSNPIRLYGDISDWGGICVTYAADRDVLLKLYTDSVTFYKTDLVKSNEFVEKCITWDALNATEASKHASSIRFVMPGTDNTNGHLSIAAIGKYDANGTCEVDGYAEVLTKGNGNLEGLIVLRSSSSGQRASSSSSPRGDCTEPKEVSEMWNGFAAPLTTVETGLDNGTETSGYWFSFGDDMSGVGSVKWPQSLGIEYTTGDEIYDYCMGVCGELEFAKEGYLGIGFHVAGVVDPSEGDSPVAKANISEWGGLCVTYASDADLEVVLAYAQESGFGNFSRMPKMTLPKSVKLKTVCADWNKFMTVFSEVSTTFMTSILFAVQGDANTKSRFNIRGLGKYSEKTNFCEYDDDPFVSGKMGLVIK
ncbi:MAG: hypothetical protein J5534_15110 [Fibrobacter sp.]|nr:hypothetical protein [Fibrobacter sp.]